MYKHTVYIRTSHLAKKVNIKPAQYIKQWKYTTSEKLVVENELKLQAIVLANV